MITLVVIAAAAAVGSFVLMLVMLVRRQAPPDLTAVVERLARDAARSREEALASSASLRQEVTTTIGVLGATLQAAQEMLGRAVREHGAEERQELERIRCLVDERLASVDERLQGTLTQRLGESFALVSERLEQVHKGLGEMQTLANGVGDLKKVLANVKSRGGWGEVQLETLLEQMLSPEQYERNAVTKEGSRECVEFAVKFPGRGDTPLLLPIDAKFPVEDYQQLVAAQECGDGEAIETAARRLESSVRNSAKTIREKYVNSPVTTEFAIMFLPTEGLYAEVLRRPGLAEQIQRECGVLIAGPTTLTAILSSLQMGFRTLAIEKRSGEVWRLLEAIKTEFAKFGGVIEKVNRNLETARNQMDQLGVRTRAVSRKLRDVQELPESDAKLLLKLAPVSPEASEEDDGWVDA